VTTTYRELANQIADQWVAAMKNAEQVLVAIAEGSQRLAETAPKPLVEVPSFGSLDKLNEVLGENLPKPSEIVETNFEFANRLLTAQRDLTLRLLEVNAAQAEAAKPARAKNA
jgi:hypothetical protein